MQPMERRMPMAHAIDSIVNEERIPPLYTQGVTYILHSERNKHIPFYIKVKQTFLLFK